MNKSLIALFAGILLSALAAHFSCAKQPATFAFLDFFMGTVEVLKAGSGAEPAVVKMPLSRDDAVKTGAKSTAFIQCGADNLTQVFENTEFRLDTLPARQDSSAGETVLELIAGKASFFIEKLVVGGRFELKVAGVRAAVRGTLFHAALEGKGVVLVVKEGALAVSSEKNDFQRFVLEAGKKALIEGNDVRITSMEAADEAWFRELSRLRPIAGIACTPPEHVERFFRWRLDLAPASEKDAPKADDVKKKGAPAGETKAAAPEDKAPAAKARLVVTRLAPNGVETAEAEDISKKVYSALVASKGAGQVLYRAAGDRRSANRALTGRVSKLGRSRVIAVSVVDGEKGSVLYNKTATVREDAELEAQIATIAREIGAQANLWE